jgi:predicted ArsR family transcriptional regulator
MPKRRSSHKKPVDGGIRPGSANLFGATRNQILSELCGRRLTAVELADRFAISSNAIRAHLGALHGAQLVRYETESRGVGKPTHVYELTAEAEHLLSRAYAPALSALLDSAREASGDRFSEIVYDAGRRLALANSTHPAATGNLRRRAEDCAALLRSFGGSPELEEEAGRFLIRSECCPLAAVVREQPACCKLFEGMARELTGRAVEERCDRTRRPHCTFVIPRASPR